MDSSVCFYCGYKLLYNFGHILTVTLQADMYNDIVHRASLQMKVFLVVKCILHIVCRTPRHHNKEVFLNQEVFRTMIRSFQNSYKVSLKNKIKSNGINYFDPRLTRQDSERLFGTDHVPIVSHPDPITTLFIRHSLQVHLLDSYAIYTNCRETTHKIRRGPLGIYMEKAENLILKYVHECVT